MEQEGAQPMIRWQSNDCREVTPPADWKSWVAIVTEALGPDVVGARVTFTSNEADGWSVRVTKHDGERELDERVTAPLTAKVKAALLKAKKPVVG